MAGYGSQPGERKGGRQKGTPNKFTVDLRDMILTALHEAGGIEYLTARAHDQPASFLALIGKILPKQVDARVTTDFSSWSDEELDAYISDQTRALGYEPSASGLAAGEKRSLKVVGNQQS